jgi:methylphosphotriester-DNA--protein-cysteine methyltransferase
LTASTNNYERRSEVVESICSLVEKEPLFNRRVSQAAKESGGDVIEDLRLFPRGEDTNGRIGARARRAPRLTS